MASLPTFNTQLVPSAQVTLARSLVVSLQDDPEQSACASWPSVSSQFAELSQVSEARSPSVPVQRDFAQPVALSFPLFSVQFAPSAQEYAQRSQVAGWQVLAVHVQSAVMHTGTTGVHPSISNRMRRERLMEPTVAHA